MTVLLCLLIAVNAEAAPTTDDTIGVDWAAADVAKPIAATATPVRYDDVAPVTPVTPTKPTSPAPPIESTPTTSGFEQRIIALELALSTIVVESPTLWRFDRLEAEAADLLSTAAGEPQRQAVRNVTARIDGFRRLAARIRSEQESPSGWRSPNIAAASPRIAPPVRLTKTETRDGRHDAVGVLRPVVSKRPDAPKYAVVDAEGRIAALVTPSQQLDDRLKQLVGKRVGLDGQRGYLTDLRRDHLVAERVTPLDTLRR